MDIMELMKSRHSVRQYLDKAIPGKIREQLNSYSEELNREGDLKIQIIYDEPLCFNTRMAHYGKFENAKNYIAMVGRKSGDLEERCGYFGEKLVLKAQELGLNTCYGKTHGTSRKSKPAAAVSNISDSSPEWFKRGVEASLLAPTAINQQKFKFTLDGNTVSAKSGKLGTNLKVDLGIVKCHFELGAGKDNFKWI